MKFRRIHVLIIGYALIFMPVLVAWHLFFNDFFFIIRQVNIPGSYSFQMPADSIILARVLMILFILCSISKFGYHLVNYAYKHLDKMWFIEVIKVVD